MFSPTIVYAATRGQLSGAKFTASTPHRSSRAMQIKIFYRFNYREKTPLPASDITPVALLNLRAYFVSENVACRMHRADNNNRTFAKR